MEKARTAELLSPEQQLVHDIITVNQEYKRGEALQREVIDLSKDFRLQLLAESGEVVDDPAQLESMHGSGFLQGTANRSLMIHIKEFKAREISSRAVHNFLELSEQLRQDFWDRKVRITSLNPEIEPIAEIIHKSEGRTKTKLHSEVEGYIFKADCLSSHGKLQVWPKNKLTSKEFWVDVADSDFNPLINIEFLD